VSWAISIQQLNLNCKELLAQLSMHDNKAITLIAFVCQIIIIELEIFRRESRKTITSKASPRLAFYYAGYFLAWNV